MFQKRKVLITRRATGGSPWAVQAAVDEIRLYPGGDFISVSPEPWISCELIAGLFNSALINCWLRLVNPSRDIRVSACTAIPIPKVWPAGAEQRIEALAREISNLRYQVAVRHDTSNDTRRKLEGKTLALDEAVYDAYQLPEELRAQVGAYLMRHRKPRPGFDRPILKERKVKRPTPNEVFTVDDAQKMKTLFEARSERQLTQAELSELESLVSRWERARVLSSNAALEAERPEWTESISSTTESEAI